MRSAKRKKASAALAIALAMVVAACGGAEEPAQPAPAPVAPQPEAPQEDEAPVDEAWPTTLTIYVPANAGGGFDILVRTLQPYLEDELENRVIVENLPGAAGAVAAQQMLGEPSDGSRIMIVSRTIMGVPYTGTPDIDPLTIHTPLGLVSEDVSAVTVRADSPFQTIDDLVQAALANPGGLQVGNSGIGSVWHSSALLFEAASGAEFAHIPYSGGAPAGAALIAGEVDFITTGAPEVLGFVEAGEARVLAVMSEERSPLYPDTPTLQELGYDVLYGVWRGFVINSDAPSDVVESLIRRIERAASNPAFVEDMAALGFVAQHQSPEAMLALMEIEDVVFPDLYRDLEFFTTRPARLG